MTGGKFQPAFTLIETLIGIAMLSLVAFSLYATYVQLIKVTRHSKIRIAATTVANEYLEIVRNLPYSQVGVVGGIPNGSLPANQSASRDDFIFNVHYTVRNVDDPFDGTISGSPNDTSPADYKQATVEVTCTNCDALAPQVTLVTNVTPKNLETATNNGALFIKVFDAAGQPVSSASVSVTNSTVSPPVNLNETTNTDGLLALVDVPPALESYRIVVTKTGYSTERTYGPDDPVVINPVKLDATVIVQQVTQMSFIIDRVSTINVASMTITCTPVGNVDFTLDGAKLIGTNPDILKYSQNLSTNGSGLLTLSNMEWDAYSATVTDSSYEPQGTIPLLPFNLAPNSTQDLSLIMRESSPHSLLVVVKDAATQLPISGASVRLTKSGYDETVVTSRGYWRQTNWKDGPNQADFIDQEKYWADDGNIVTNNPVGQVKLKKSGSRYVLNGNLTSSTFDMGASSNLATIEWQPADQPAQTGADSVRFQIASNNDNATWNFLGPDGTASTYYTVSGSTLSSAHNGHRYVRYKVFLSTANNRYTPNISDVAVTFVSNCVPPGQAFFTSLTSATYTLEVSASGYETGTTSVDLSPNWTKQEVSLLPI